MFPVPFEYVLFFCILTGVAVAHRSALVLSLIGLAVMGSFKLAQGFDLLTHVGHEWVELVNLVGLLLGFALLADHFERSHVPSLLPRWLPDDWTGALALLVVVFVMSAFLDNIAGAVIGGTIARAVFRNRVRIGYLAAIVAAANAGGTGSVVGDTTTTMMWIDGVPPLAMVKAYGAAIPALVVFGTIAARQQHVHQPIAPDEEAHPPVDLARVGIVGLLLVATVGTNLLVNTQFATWAHSAPWLGMALWSAILATHAIRPAGFALLPEAARGAVFLGALVMTASLLPVGDLPTPTPLTTLAIGFLSAIFDNIPLTALALEQGGYDWGVLAYAVGYGGSMLWFGSSAGVALTNEFPEARNTTAWVQQGWPVIVGYVVGYAILIALWGWSPG